MSRAPQGVEPHPGKPGVPHQCLCFLFCCNLQVENNHTHLHCNSKVTSQCRYSADALYPEGLTIKGKY